MVNKRRSGEAATDDTVTVTGTGTGNADDIEGTVPQPITEGKALSEGKPKGCQPLPSGLWQAQIYFGGHLLCRCRQRIVVIHHNHPYI